mgnify:CR=1 FL=1
MPGAFGNICSLNKHMALKGNCLLLCCVMLSRICQNGQRESTFFAPPGNLMDKYRIVGNAVPPIFGKVLLESIVRFES